MEEEEEKMEEENEDAEMEESEEVQLPETLTIFNWSLNVQSALERL